jgi:hypothetical protein
VAPPGNQAATEKTNINLYHSENPVYSPKVGAFELNLNTKAYILYFSLDLYSTHIILGDGRGSR